MYSYVYNNKYIVYLQRQFKDVLCADAKEVLSGKRACWIYAVGFFGLNSQMRKASPVLLQNQHTVRYIEFASYSERNRLLGMRKGRGDETLQD
jgi:hypothetical protein